MEPWEENLINVISVFLTIIIVMLIVSAVVTIGIFVASVVMIIRDRIQLKRFENLQDRMMEQAEIGLKEREERI